MIGKRVSKIKVKAPKKTSGDLDLDDFYDFMKISCNKTQVFN